jgi:DNA-binding NarL/FixJ family response regulator
MNPSEARILLADDHDVVRAGVRTMLEAQKGWHVCAEASSGRESVRLAAEMQLDIAVLDLQMPDMDGVTATRGIKEHQPQIEVVVFTGHDDEYLIRNVMNAGVRAVVLKAEGGRKLIQAVESALRHQPFFTPRASETLVSTFLKSPAEISGAGLLTYREREIVQLLAGGSSNKEVAVILGISVKTVETHRATIMRKLGVSSIVELVRYAVREHFIKA